MRDRFTLDGFDAKRVAADHDIDVLITETTYGKPEYVFEEQDVLETRIVDWLDDTHETPVILFGYTLGRAQELELLVHRSERERLFVTEATERLNDVVGNAHDIDFAAERYEQDVTIGAGDTLVLPAQTNKLSFVDHIVENTGAAKAGFSGWAIENSFKYRGDYDETFVLSDHSDFSELITTVEALNPERVYTQHGFADAFATYLESELDIKAVLSGKDFVGYPSTVTSVARRSPPPCAGDGTNRSNASAGVSSWSQSRLMCGRSSL